MKRILIAFDGTPGAEAAMLDLVRGGFPDRCEATVLTIADVWLPPEFETRGLPDRLSATRMSARQHALEVLAEARRISARGAERLRSLFPHWTIHHKAHTESPSWGILAEARQWPADLVVVGSHGRSPLQKFFLGSVSFKVAAEAACSVRIFRANHHHPGPSLRVLLAVDGSSDSDAAVEEALNRKWPPDTSFHLVTVIDEKLKTAAAWDTRFGPDDYPMDSTGDFLAPLLAGNVEKFHKRRFEASSHIFEGDPKGLLLHHAETWKADCIFLGARGLQHGNRLYLGTFASAIASRAHCTVEIVRPSSTPGATASRDKARALQTA